MSTLTENRQPLNDFLVEGISNDPNNLGRAARGAHYLIVGILGRQDPEGLEPLEDALERFKQQPFQYDPKNPEKTLTLDGIRLLLGHRDFAFRTPEGELLNLDERGVPNFEIIAPDHATLVR